MKKSQIILNDEQTVQIGEETLSFGNLHFMKDDEYKSYKRLVRSFVKVGDEKNLEEYIITRSSNDVLYSIPFDELGLWAYPAHYMNMPGYRNGCCLQIRSHHVRKIMSLGKLLSSEEMLMWQESEDRNFLYELFIRKEFASKFEWEPLKRKIFDKIVEAVKTTPDDALLDCDSAGNIHKQPMLIIPESDFSDEELVEVKKYEGVSYMPIGLFNSEKCDIVVSIGNATDVLRKTMVLARFCEKSLYLVLLPDTVEIAERISKYDKKAIYERQEKKRAYDMGKAEEEDEWQERKFVIIVILATVLGLLLLFCLLSHGVVTETNFKRVITSIAFVLMAVPVFVGARHVYNKWSYGDSDWKRSAIGWIGGFVFTLIVIAILKNC